jgi:GntR family transcriptional regulator
MAVEDLAVIDFGGLPGSPDVPVRRLTYRQIADDLADRIAKGEYAPGSRLPSYAQLAALYNVSVSTASRAIAILSDRGVVEGEPGRGVFVPEEASE